MNPKKSTKLYKVFSEETGTEENLVESLLEFYYKEIRSCLTNLVHPRINVEGLGHIIAKTTVVSKSIEKIKKVLDNHDVSTFNAYHHKKSMEIKLDKLISLQSIIESEKHRKQKFKNKDNESSTKSNLGE
jgi:Ribonuclease G/E